MIEDEVGGYLLFLEGYQGGAGGGDILLREVGMVVALMTLVCVVLVVVVVFMVLFDVVVFVIRDWR